MKRRGRPPLPPEQRLPPKPRPRTARARLGLYYLPEAALILHVSVGYLRRWLYHPAYRDGFTHIRRRTGAHPRRYRLLSGPDVDRLAYLILCRGLTMIGAMRHGEMPPPPDVVK